MPYTGEGADLALTEEEEAAIEAAALIRFRPACVELLEVAAEDVTRRSRRLAAKAARERASRLARKAEREAG